LEILLKRFVFILTLFFIFSADQADSKIWHNLVIGFNLGYPDRVGFTEPALQEIEHLGIQDVRIYEIFNGRQDQSYQNRLKKALDRILAHKMRPMIAISNIHARLLPDKKARKVMRAKLPWRVTVKVNHILSYSNRFPPSNLEGYRFSIQELLDFLFAHYGKVQVQNWLFEIGNEPDAHLYFWGDVEQFSEMYQAAIQVLNHNGLRRVGSFGSTSHPIFFDPAWKRSDPYRSLLANLAGNIQKNGFLSFHLYERQGAPTRPLDDLPRWLSNTTFPVMITEWNVHSNGKMAAAVFSDPIKWGAKFIYLLADCEQYSIDRLYIFNLMDDPKHKTLQLGAFDRQGKPKPWFSAFKLIYKVIRRGYRVILNKGLLIIEGAEGQCLVMALDQEEELPAQIVYAPSWKGTSNRKLHPGEWVIILQDS
jgi:hypothetical protein